MSNGKKKMKTFYCTFPLDHPLQYFVQEIEAPDMDTAKVGMTRFYGGNWAFCYDADEMIKLRERYCYVDNNVNINRVIVYDGKSSFYTKDKQRRNKMKISFYKKRKCWYAEVKEHSEAQNQMVAGADTLCENAACGKKRVTLEVSSDEKNADKAIAVLRKVEQSPYGATYDVDSSEESMRGKCWLCNVTRTVFGTHPDVICIMGIEPNDNTPYSE